MEEKMPRVVKAHDERKQELVKTAGALFQERGFRNTSVSDIVSRTGVAPGNLLLLLREQGSRAGSHSERAHRQRVHAGEDCCESKSEEAGLRLRMILESFVDFSRSEDARIFRLLREEEQVLIADRAREYWNRKLFPLLNSVIDQGMREGVMKVEHRDETLLFFWKVFHAYCEGVFKGEEPRRLDVKRQLFEKLANVLLGMENWTFRPEPERSA
jgi:Bacterial regulatory proteins, tetR family.